MRKKVRPEPIMITLCARCVSQFYSANRYQMRRVDFYQINKDECTFCGCRRGYDYLLYPGKEKGSCIRRISRRRDSRDVCYVDINGRETEGWK